MRPCIGGADCPSLLVGRERILPEAYALVGDGGARDAGAGVMDDRLRSLPAGPRIDPGNGRVCVRVELVLAPDSRRMALMVGDAFGSYTTGPGWNPLWRRAEYGRGEADAGVRVGATGEMTFRPRGFSEPRRGC